MVFMAGKQTVRSGKSVKSRRRSQSTHGAAHKNSKSPTTVSDKWPTTINPNIRATLQKTSWSQQGPPPPKRVPFTATPSIATVKAIPTPNQATTTRASAHTGRGPGATTPLAVPTFPQPAQDAVQRVGRRESDIRTAVRGGQETPSTPNPNEESENQRIGTILAQVKATLEEAGYAGPQEAKKPVSILKAGKIGGAGPVEDAAAANPAVRRNFAAKNKAALNKILNLLKVNRMFKKKKGAGAGAGPEDTGIALEGADFDELTTPPPETVTPARNGSSAGVGVGLGGYPIGLPAGQTGSRMMARRSSAMPPMLKPPTGSVRRSPRSRSSRSRSEGRHRTRSSSRGSRRRSRSDDDRAKYDQRNKPMDNNYGPDGGGRYREGNRNYAGDAGYNQGYGKDGYGARGPNGEPLFGPNGEPLFPANQYGGPNAGQQGPTGTTGESPEGALVDDPWVRGQPETRPNLRGGTSPVEYNPDGTVRDNRGSANTEDGEWQRLSERYRRGTTSKPGSARDLLSPGEDFLHRLNQNSPHYANRRVSRNSILPSMDSGDEDEPFPAVLDYSCVNMGHRNICQMVGCKKDTPAPKKSCRPSRKKTIHWHESDNRKKSTVRKDPDELERIYRGVELYTFGGYDGGSFNQDETRAIMRYNLEEETWTVHGYMPVVRIYPAVVTYGDFIYVIGGSNADCSSSAASTDRGPSNTFFRYTPAANSWFQLPPMNSRRMHATAIAFSGIIMVFGGQDETDRILDTMEIYDIDKMIWRTGSALRLPIMAASAALIGGIVHVVGGITEPKLDDRNRFNVSPRVFAYDPYRNEWSTKHYLPVRRAHHGAVGVDGMTHVLGGAYPGRESQFSEGEPSHYLASNDVFVYDPSKDKWRKSALLNEARFDFGIAAVGQEIIVAGGWGEKREETTNTTEHYDVYKGTVRYGGCLPLKRTAFQMVAFHSYDVITPQTCHGVCPAVCFDADRGKCMQKTANGYETMEETRRMY